MTDDNPTPVVPFDEACTFLTKLGTAAHNYGSNAARLESYLSRVTQALGYSGVFRSTPTEITFAFQQSPDRAPQMRLVGFPGTGLELNRLAQVGELVDSVVAGQVSVAEASARLDEIAQIPHPWGLVSSGASYVFAGAAFAMLLSGSWWDVAFSALYSLVVYAMVLLAGRFGPLTAAWVPLATALVAGALAAGTKVLLPELNLVVVTLSAILILIPGYPVSVGVIELTGSHVVSGMANLMGGLVYLAKQFIGAWLGVKLVALVVAIPHAAAGVPVDPTWLWLGVPLLIASLCLAFQTSGRDFIWAALACGLAYGGILLGSAFGGANLGNLVGTAAAVVYANLWASRTRRPTSIVLLPAIVLLVSGSIGFRGLVAIVTGHDVAGVEQFAQMFVVALTIAAGLLVGHTLVRPKATL